MHVPYGLHVSRHHADPIAPPPLAVACTGVAGFVGIAERGPLDAPVRLASWGEFVATFGDGGDGYLADSVHGFFGNGGVACWVVRVARGAAAAELVLADGWRKPVARVAARDPGAWGNAIAVRCERSGGAETLVVRDVELGACEAHVPTTKGFEVGAVVRLWSEHASDHVVITELGDRLLRWTTATPIDHRHPANAPTRVDLVAFTLEVALAGRRERFTGLQLDRASPSYAPHVIARRSKLIRLDDLGERTPSPPHHLPANVVTTRLRGGRDGVDELGADELVGHDRGPGDRTGIAALAAVDEVAIVAVPDAMWLHDRALGPRGTLAAQRVQDELVAACERRDDRFAILDLPRTTEVDVVGRWRGRVDSGYAAFYWPWLEAAPRDGRAAMRVVPPSGLVAGCYARRDRDGVHHAPANLAVTGVRDVALRLTDEDVATLDAAAINTFRVQRGVRPWGARTTSSQPAWRQISVRRLFIMLRRALDAGFAWVAFEPNDARTQALVRDRVAAFLGELHAAGMLAGARPEDAFYVRCDGETNPPGDVDQGLLRCEVGVAPVVPAEFLVLCLVHAVSTPASR